MQAEARIPAEESTSPLLPLRRLRLELSLDCPLHCVHCSAHAAPHHPLSMPTDLAYRLVEEFARLGGEEITFTGGEPLVDRRLSSLLTAATQRGLSTVVFTSGIVHGADGPACLSMEHVIALAPVVNRAVISVYSQDPAVHDAVTFTVGSLCLTREAVRRLIAGGVRVEWHFVPTAVNYRDLPALVADARDLGVATIRVIRYVPQGRGRQYDNRLRLSVVQQIELRGIIAELRSTAASMLKIGSAFGYLLYDAPACTAAVDELVVSAEGWVYPCSGFVGIRRHTALDNVRDLPLARVWEQSPYLRAVREMVLAQSSAPQAGACHAGCPAQRAVAGNPSWASAVDPDAAALRQVDLPGVAQSDAR